MIHKGQFGVFVGSINGANKMVRCPAWGCQIEHTEIGAMIILNHCPDFIYSLVLDYSLFVSGALIVPLIEWSFSS